MKEKPDLLAKARDKFIKSAPPPSQKPAAQNSEGVSSSAPSPVAKKSSADLVKLGIVVRHSDVQILNRIIGDLRTTGVSATVSGVVRLALRKLPKTEIKASEYQEILGEDRRSQKAAQKVAVG